MKLMIASDIHGSDYYCEQLIEAFSREQADRLLLLGDLLYHGPRNDLPRGYAPKSVIERLNSIKEHILCVRGNCDTEVDQMVFQFPILADYCILSIGSCTVYATHGHRFGEENPPPLQNGDILLCGHTHIPCYARHDGYLYLNPGSVSIPKDGSAHGYMIMTEHLLEWKTLDGTIWQSYPISTP